MHIISVNLRFFSLQKILIVSDQQFVKENHDYCLFLTHKIVAPHFFCALPMEIKKVVEKNIRKNTATDLFPHGSNN